MTDLADKDFGVCRGSSSRLQFLIDPNLAIEHPDSDLIEIYEQLKLVNSSFSEDDDLTVEEELENSLVLSTINLN